MTTTEIKFEVGKYYRTRGGEKVKLLEIWPDGTMLFAPLPAKSVFWTSRYGQYDLMESHFRDIVSEWRDPRHW